MSRSQPRAVVVTRPTEYESLLERHATHGQAAFFLAGRGQDVGVAVERHQRVARARAAALDAIPGSWRRSVVSRSALDRFLFEPEDVVLVVGQDGLVANLAKYLQGQRVIGINADPELNVGVLVPHAPERAAALLRATAEGAAEVEQRLSGPGPRVV